MNDHPTKSTPEAHLDSPAPNFTFSRINIVGTSGSGKSTFARKLSVALQLPYVEMDKVFWRPHWEMPNDEDFFRDLRRALEGPEWVLDGNYTRSTSIKWEKVQAVIWLDYPFSITLYQAITRAIKRAWTQEELWEGTGNRESFQRGFLSKDSIIWWTISTYGKVRKKYERIMAAPEFAHIKFIRLRNRSEANTFLSQITEVRSRQFREKNP